MFTRKFGTHNREIFFSQSGKRKPNLDCNYPFPIDLAPIGSPFGAKSIIHKSKSIITYINLLYILKV